MLFKYLLCARHYSRYLRYKCEYDIVPASLEGIIY